MRKREKSNPILGAALLDEIDFADPTRSREAKPSERLRQSVRFRRGLRTVFTSIGLLFLLMMLLWLLATAH